MKITNEQLKLFVEGVFLKHSLNNEDSLNITQLYDFFSAVLKTPFSIQDVQQTLRQIRTSNTDRITKK